MWHKIFFNSQNIKAEGQLSVLIKMPNNSIYNGYYFWHSKKLVREQGGNGYHYTFSFTDDFTFKLKKYGAGKYNSKDVIREIEIKAAEMMEIFGVVNENVHLSVELETDKINDKIAKYEETEIIVQKHIPERIQPIKNLQPDKTLMK